MFEIIAQVTQAPSNSTGLSGDQIVTIVVACVAACSGIVVALLTHWLTTGRKRKERIIALPGLLRGQVVKCTSFLDEIGFQNIQAKYLLSAAKLHGKIFKQLEEERENLLKEKERNTENDKGEASKIIDEKIAKNDKDRFLVKEQIDFLNRQISASNDKKKDSLCDRAASFCEIMQVLGELKGIYSNKQIVKKEIETLILLVYEYPKLSPRYPNIEDVSTQSDLEQWLRGAQDACCLFHEKHFVKPIENIVNKIELIDKNSY